MTPEQQFWSMVKDHLPGIKERVENLVNDGTPDVSAGWRGIDYWVELKVCGNKKKEKNPADLCRPSQLVWHARRGREGSIIFVMVRYPAAIRTYAWRRYATYENTLTETMTGKRFFWEHFERKFIYILYKERKKSDDLHRLRDPGATG